MLVAIKVINTVPIGGLKVTELTVDGVVYKFKDDARVGHKQRSNIEFASIACNQPELFSQLERKQALKAGTTSARACLKANKTFIESQTELKLS